MRLELLTEMIDLLEEAQSKPERIVTVLWAEPRPDF